ncbi:MAG: hypothetical protein AB1938_09615 [Myxococcota bacterium]
MAFAASSLACVLVAATPPPVADVVAGTNSVVVVRDGATRSIAPGLGLFIDDVVRVPLKGLLFVKVRKNDLVVRLDEDLELKVADLAALHIERRTTESLEQQLDKLLTPAEKKDRGSGRMVGWFVSPAAADVPTLPSGGSSERKTSASPTRTESTQRQPPPPPPPAPPKAPALIVSEEKTKPPAESVTGGGEDPGKLADAERRSKRKIAAEPEEAVGRASASAHSITLKEADRRCFADFAKSLDATVRKQLGPTLRVRVRKIDGGVRVFLEGALPVTNACIESWAAAQKLTTPSGWNDFEVPLE